MAITSSFNGCSFSKSGVCDRCPLEEAAPCCVGCPHFARVNGVNTCQIYATRDQVCKSCQALGKFTDGNGTHADCISWPPHPFVAPIKSGKCAFKFTPKSQADATKLADIYSKW